MTDGTQTTEAAQDETQPAAVATRKVDSKIVGQMAAMRYIRQLAHTSPLHGIGQRLSDIAALAKGDKTPAQFREDGQAKRGATRKDQQKRQKQFDKEAQERKEKLEGRNRMQTDDGQNRAG